jgi:hypothetical protein
VKVASVDPGRTGFECLIDTTPGPSGAFVHRDPVFRPAPLTRKVTKEGEIVHDPEGDYDLSLMIQTARCWFADGVRLVVIEQQAPQRHGAQKEGTVSSWTNGYGFGAWIASLYAAGFVRVDEATVKRADEGTLTPCFVIVEPLVWKRRMACVSSSHAGEDSHAARRKAANARTVEVARRLAPAIDWRATERGGGTKRSDCPDKAASFLLARYATDWILGDGEKVKA